MSYFNWIALMFILLIKLNMKQLRQTILADAQLSASRSRFGLFSQPPPLGLGDDSPYVSKKPIIGQNGKPKTQPRNMLPGQNRSGMGKKSYIQVPDSIYQKDPYKDQLSVELQYQNSMHRKSPMHEVDFKPASGFKTIVSGCYPHKEEKQYQQKKAKKDENGRVKTEPSNILTNKTSRVEDKLFKHPPHMRDQYNRQRQVERQEKDAWKKKIIHQTMFKSMSHGGSTFTNDKRQFGHDDRSKLIMSQKKPQHYGNVKTVTHDANFKLARRGHGDPIGRYPQYVKPRERAQTEASESMRTKTQKGQNDREDWKPSTGNFTRPTPSIGLMAKNMRRYY